jgi:hypothetical protein
MPTPGLRFRLKCKSPHNEAGIFLFSTDAQASMSPVSRYW